MSRLISLMFLPLPVRPAISSNGITPKIRMESELGSVTEQKNLRYLLNATRYNQIYYEGLI